MVVPATTLFSAPAATTSSSVGWVATRCTGGSGADKFVYLSAAESPNFRRPDTITDFTHGTDKIDFTSLAYSGSGGTLFWSGTTAAPHGVWVTHTGSGCDVVTNIYADTTGDPDARPAYCA